MGGSRDFSGVNQYLTVSDHADFSPALTAFSITGWWYPDVTTVGGWIGKYGSSLEWCVGSTNGGALYWFVYDNTTNGYRGRYASTGWTAGSWQRFAFTYDGGTSASSCEIWRNGVQIDDNDFSSGTFTTIRDTSQVVTVGQASGWSGTEFNGRIAHLQFFKKKLSEAECEETLFTPGDHTDNVISYLKLTGLDTTEPDMSGNGHSAANTGTTEYADGPPIEWSMARMGHWATPAAPPSGTGFPFQLYYGGGLSV